MDFRRKWGPSTDLEHLHGEFDELLERLGSDHRRIKVRPTAWNRPPVESFIDGDNFVVRVHLPGVDPKNIDLQVVDDTLTIKASFFRDEIRYGSFERAIGLPQGVKAEQLNAVYRDGRARTQSAGAREVCCQSHQGSDRRKEVFRRKKAP